MQLPPKCPACQKPITKAALVKIETDTQQTKLYGPLPPYGLGYVCPNPQCNVLLPVWPAEGGKLYSCPDAPQASAVLPT